MRLPNNHGHGASHPLRWIARRRLLQSERSEVGIMGYRRKARKDGAANLRGHSDTKGFALAAFTCEAHGKKTWMDRKEARRTIRTMRWGGVDSSRMREYRCDVTGHWHVGHMPPDVVAGVVSMSEARETINRRDRKRRAAE